MNVHPKEIRLAFPRLLRAIRFQAHMSLNEAINVLKVYCNQGPHMSVYPLCEAAWHYTKRHVGLDRWERAQLIIRDAIKNRKYARLYGPPVLFPGDVDPEVNTRPLV